MAREPVAGSLQGDRNNDSGAGRSGGGKAGVGVGIAVHAVLVRVIRRAVRRTHSSGSGANNAMLALAGLVYGGARQRKKCPEAGFRRQSRRRVGPWLAPGLGPASKLHTPAPATSAGSFLADQPSRDAAARLLMVSA